jgi:hypothetical protein
MRPLLPASLARGAHAKIRCPGQRPVGSYAVHKTRTPHIPALIHNWDNSLSGLAPDPPEPAGWDGGGTVRIWNPVTGSGIASTRLSGPLAHLEWSRVTVVVAAGAFGPYIFKFSGERATQ